MHDTAPEGDDGHREAILSPGSNAISRACCGSSNQADTDASVAIKGTDNKGQWPGEGATVTPSRSSVSYTAAELESGHAEGLTGSIGDARASGG